MSYIKFRDISIYQRCIHFHRFRVDFQHVKERVIPKVHKRFQNVPMIYNLSNNINNISFSDEISIFTAKNFSVYCMDTFS